jgi:hypothetical protein
MHFSVPANELAFMIEANFSRAGPAPIIAECN